MADRKRETPPQAEGDRGPSFEEALARLETIVEELEGQGTEGPGSRRDEGHARPGARAAAPRQTDKPPRTDRGPEELPF